MYVYTRTVLMGHRLLRTRRRRWGTVEYWQEALTGRVWTVVK